MQAVPITGREDLSVMDATCSYSVDAGRMLQVEESLAQLSKTVSNCETSIQDRKDVQQPLHAGAVTDRHAKTEQLMELSNTVSQLSNDVESKCKTSNDQVQAILLKIPNFEKQLSHLLQKTTALQVSVLKTALGVNDI